MDGDERGKVTPHSLLCSYLVPFLENSQVYFVDVDGTKNIKEYRKEWLTMYIKGNCAIYIDKNLRVNVYSNGIVSL